MNKLAVILSVGFFGALCTSCTPDATEQELKAMCENLVELRGEVKLIKLDEAIAEVEEDFAQREKNNKRAAEMEKEDWDVELEAKLKEMRAAMDAGASEDEDEDEEEEEKPTEEDIQALKEKYEAKKVETDKRYAERAKEFGPDKELGLKAVREKAEKAKAVFDKAVDECLAEAKQEAVTQPVAQCRAKATSRDEYWNKCR